MLTAIANLLAAAAYALKIWSINAYYNLQKRIEADIDAQEVARDQLRAVGTPDSERRADILQQRLLRAQGIAVALPAPGAAATGGKDGGNA